MTREATSADSAPDERQAYATLDGLRGVAALAVVFYHFASDLFAPHGYLAVDLFFAMSGFVVASAYERRLRSGGLGVGGFFGVRVRRLAPLWLLGVATGLALALIVPMGDSARDLVLLALPALLLAPVGTTLVGAFPLNTSLWSLNVEMVVNVAYALFNRFLSTRVLLAVAAASFVGLTVIAYQLGAVSYGTSKLDLLAGYLRALISFPVGVVLRRLRARLPKLKLGVLTLFLIAGLLMTGIGINARNAWGVTYDLAFIAVAVPMLVILAVNNEPSPRFRLLFSRMGSGSYALYALHQPIIHAARRVAADHGGVPTYMMIGVGLIPGLVLLAWLVDRLFDTPIRRWLKTPAVTPIAASPIEAEPA